ncbi:hypothetical protein T08_7761 [Trichinella sp. T8]|nr:hypothetical protein T08_7761 [Trichinella sp. T8]
MGVLVAARLVHYPQAALDLQVHSTTYSSDSEVALAWPGRGCDEAGSGKPMVARSKMARGTAANMAAEAGRPRARPTDPTGGRTHVRKGTWALMTTEDPLHLDKAHCRRFTKNCRSPARERQGARELQDAKEMWVRLTPEEEFRAEIEALVRHGRVAAHSRISQFDPYMDEYLSASMQYPAILPGNHELTGGLIHQCHQRQLHAGAEQTLAFLRQRYWVPKGRHQVKRMARECMVCRRAIGRSAQPRMAALPRDRAVQALAMSQVGINIARPLFVRVGRGATSPRDGPSDDHGKSTASPLTIHGQEKQVEYHTIRQLPLISGSRLRITSAVADCGRLSRELMRRRIQWKFTSKRAP